MDCADVKTLMSGLLDDTLEPQVRHDAERHIAECDPCRALVNEAERIDLLLARESSGWSDDSLSTEFEANVLARTVLADPQRNSHTRWRRPFRWLASAAAMMLIAGGAITIWSQSKGNWPWFENNNEFATDTSRSTFDTPSHAVTTTNYRTALGRRSWTFDPNETPAREQNTTIARNEKTTAREDDHESPAQNIQDNTVDPSTTLAKTIRSAQRHLAIIEPGKPEPESSKRQERNDESAANTHSDTTTDHPNVTHASHANGSRAPENQVSQANGSHRVPASMRREHAEAIDSASWLIERLSEARTDTFVDVERVRETVEFDNVLDRLAEARKHVAPADRPALLAVESILLRIVNGPVSLTDVREIRATVNEHDLADQLQAISQRWYKTHPI